MIDPRAIIDTSAEIGDDVEIGPWSWIGPNVKIGSGSRIASHVVVKGPTEIGRNNRIFQFSSVGEDTPATAYQGEATRLVIGDDNVIREGVTIHRGTVQDSGVTVIGSRCLLMAYVHVGHDCVLGDDVIMANNASVSGHVKVGDYANFGGYSGVAQFRAVGAFTHIAAMSLVVKDIPAFVTAAGQPARAVGLNTEGMRRRGLDRPQMQALKRAYRTLYSHGLTADEAVREICRTDDALVKAFAESVEQSQFGIVRPRTA